MEKIQRVGRQVETFIRKHMVETFAAVVGLLAMNAILLADAYWETKKINPTTAGQLGDFVGGYVGTAFALFSVVLLYRTLRNQYESARLQSFESRYFELIKIHRDNVAEMQLQGVQGRRVFLSIQRELLAARAMARNIAESMSLEMSQQQLIHIAYYSIFFGAGPGSSRMLKVALSEYPLEFVDKLDARLKDADARNEIATTMSLGYTPFEGHQSRLGHYYRHLYQSVSYVHKKDLTIDKYDYIKTIRAQLSTHEQALLLFNSLCPIGKKWWSDGLLLDYGMVKNIPQNFLDPTNHLDLSEFFPEGYFEWEE